MDEREAIRHDSKGKNLDPELEARIKHIENLNVQEELARLAPEFNEALKRGPKETSGLVEMQKWFAKLRPPVKTDEHG
jgi:hypothetical protein